jgi:hypothetical protein
MNMVPHHDEFINLEFSGSHVAAKHLDKKCGHSICLKYRFAVSRPAGDEKGAGLSFQVLRVRWTGWSGHSRG